MSISEFIQKGKGLLNSNSLVKGSIIYVFGSVFLKGVSFILIPLYTSIFSPADYGAMELFNTVMSLLMILVTFGFSQLIYIEYTHFDQIAKKVFIGKINYSFNLLAIPILVVLGIFLFIYQAEIFSTYQPYIIILIILIVYLGFFQNNLYTVLQLDQNPKLVTINKVFAGVCMLALNIILVRYLKVGIVGVYLSNCLSIIIALLLMQNSFGKNNSYLISKKIKFDEVKRLASEGMPFIITSLAYFGVNGADRFIIKYLLGEEQLGLYSLGFKFGAMLEPLLITPILAAYNPHIFRKFAEGNFNQKIFRNSLLILLCFIIISVALPFAASVVVNEKFDSAFTLIPIFVMGFGFLFLAQMVAAPLLYLKRKKAMVLNVVIASIINILLNFGFISLLGLKGSAFAFLTTNFCWFCLTVLQARKFTKDL